MSISLREKLHHHLTAIYEDVLDEDTIATLPERLIESFKLSSSEQAFVPEPHKNLWTHEDIVLITYGDSIFDSQHSEESPLKTLHKFLDTYASSSINKVHILPFFPYSSDDGFSVIDYSTVNQGLGNWDDIEALSKDFGLMFDIVINHCSARSAWFENFISKQGKGADFFFTANPDDDLSMVVRPRTSPLLREVETTNGKEYVWCTFSHDQVDFDFRNPEVLIAFCEIIRLYLDKGATMFRLDAIAFLWKIVGSPSINLDETHEAVRLFRTLIEHAAPNTIIITETNIPNKENLTYFGNANEAHAIYNFSLPPLLLNTLVTGDCTHLKGWMMSMPPAQNGTTYFNFIASHDGIGLRPAEGLLNDDELGNLVSCMQNFGGKVSWREAGNGQKKPYELNISLIDALQGTISGPDKFQLQRFICAHAIMLGLEGIPGIYIHSMLGTPNDYERVENTGHNRSINRHRWEFNELTQNLQSQSLHRNVLTAMNRLIQIRKQQPAFHPNATQFTLQLGKRLFGFWRQSADRKQSIFCVSNITNKSKKLVLSDLNLIGTEEWRDLLSDSNDKEIGEVITLRPYQTIWLSNR
ncbi:sugar phosphorylase [Glaciecola sp. KUL10]|uniref:sugar phosphorylase n=1 Tax=Glaciecola sp. (strain KUL10) TaxID=2161813 RepID=UPI000D784786|nr:sugar phosphorylase [Glaciecola sp. KUL10]GBL03017.1 sucrose phosphorylase [Glaciecola sp. KUL10]